MNINDAAIHLGEIYARALFELAGDAKMIDAVKYDLDAFTAVTTEEKNFKKLMVSPYFQQQYKEQLLDKLFAGKLSELTVNFLKVIVRHDRTIFLPQITEKYAELWDNFHGRCTVKVIISEAMNNDEVKKISADITAAMNREVKLELNVNSSIIGGIIIRYGDKVIDNSIRGRLQRAVKTITTQARERGKINEV